jgi:hypothetical protein
LTLFFQSVRACARAPDLVAALAWPMKAQLLHDLATATEGEANALNSTIAAQTGRKMFGFLSMAVLHEREFMKKSRGDDG